MPWWLYGMMAGVVAVCIEVTYRVLGSSGAPFYRVFLYLSPLIVLSQWGIFNNWRSGPALLAAWAIFAITTTSTRLVGAWWLEEPIRWWALVGVGMMLVGSGLVVSGSGR